MKYHYEHIEIEISVEIQDHAFVGVAKFTPRVNHVSTSVVYGGFSTAEQTEENVLAHAKLLIDRATRKETVVRVPSRFRSLWFGMCNRPKAKAEAMLPSLLNLMSLKIYLD